MRKIGLTLLSTLLVTGLWLIINPASASAAILERNVARTYTLKADRVSVNETLVAKITSSRYTLPADSREVFVVFNPLVDDPKAKEKLALTIPSIQVKTDRGVALSFTTEVSGQNLLIQVRRPGNLQFGKPQTIVVTYDSFALSAKSGAIHDMYIPSFAEDFQFETDTTSTKYSTKTVIPKSFGEVNLVTPKVNVQNKDKNWELSFSQEQLTGNVSWIQVGTTQYYNFDIRQPYQASTSFPLFNNTYEVILPRDVQAGAFQQKVNFTHLSPEPSEVKLDSEGNLIGIFKVPGNQSGEIKVQGYITLTDNKDFDITKAGNISDIPDNVKTFTSPATYWESNDPKIQEKAQSLKGAETDIYKIIDKTYKFVVDQIDYSEVKRFGINQRQGALKTLEGGAAVCMEYSDLFIALLRAQGIPARAGFGYGYDPRSSNDLDTPHQWAEVYIPAQNTWIMVDTTWGEAGNQVIGGDLNHVYKYVAGKSPEDPAPVQVLFFGNMAPLTPEQFTISAIDAAPQTQSTAQADLLTKYTAQASTYQAGKLLADFDNVVTAEATKITGGNPEFGNYLRVGFYIAPLMIIVGSILSVSWWNNRRVQKKQEFKEVDLKKPVNNPRLKTELAGDAVTI